MYYDNDAHTIIRIDNASQRNATSYYFFAIM